MVWPFTLTTNLKALAALLFMLAIACAHADERALKLVPPKENASEKRFALVIGNNAYAGKAALTNPRHDAEDFGKTLKSMGFNVRQVFDANRDGMNQALRAFQADLQANPGAVALFYYAGHGMEIEGTNYLIPVGKDFDGPEEVKEDAVSTQSLLTRMQAGRARVSLVILDACRNNPWGQRGTRSIGGSGGLAAMQAPAGFLIAFAAQPGKTASDGGNGRNGLFTSKLIEEIGKPQAIYEVFNKVRDGVQRESSGAQLPEEKNVLTGETLYLAGKPAAPTIGGLKPEQMALLGKAIQGDDAALKEVRSIPSLAKLLQMSSSGNTDMQTAAFLVQQQSSKNPDRRALAIATETYMRERLQTIDELKKLDEQGNPFAVLMLEKLFDNGRSFALKSPVLSKQYSEQGKETGILPRLNSLASSGDPIAMYWMAEVYWAGLIGIKPSGVNVEDWTQKSIQGGYLPAHRLLANLYMFGKNEQLKDEAKGLRTLLKGAEAGSPECMLTLADLYSSSRRRSWLERDFKQAFYWADKALKKGSPSALAVIGEFYDQGFGVEKNYQLSVKYLKQAADLGIPSGIFQLAHAYEYGRGAFLQKNEAEAAKLYQKLVDMGNNRGYFKMGLMYRDGKGGLPKDMTKAIDYFNQGTKIGDTNSYAYLAIAYENGLGGLTKNEQEAIRLYKLGAEHTSYGQYQMGRLLEEGRLRFAKDRSEAIKYYTMAAARVPEAERALKRLQ